MYLFKTSGATMEGVMKYQKHAFCVRPRDWYRGEIVLVSKNKVDCGPNEKQIQFIMRIHEIRRIFGGEADKYWPGTASKWRWLVEGRDGIKVPVPFDLGDLIEEDRVALYKNTRVFCRVRPEDETVILSHLKNMGIQT